nr:MAG TPA: DNA pilot protein VP2 [Microviridae sp.]
MLGSGIFSVFGAGLNAAMSAGTANEQWGNQLKLMEIQNRYNEQMAKNNQQRNKDLWDYTNYENQKQHIKNAGLNPALMYGMGGGGGVSANGAQGQGVTQPTDRSVEMGLKQQGLGLQLASIASQVDLNKSQAEKNKAEAEKISGVDTKVQEATIDNLIAQTSNEKVKKGLILGQIRVADAEEELKRNTADWTKEKSEETRWNVKSLQKGIEKLIEEINGTKLDNELKKKTIDNKVKESSLTLQSLMAEILLKGSQQKVNEEQAKAIPAEILQGWEELTKKGKALIIQREQMEAYAQDVINRYELGKKGLDIEEQKLVKDVILGMLEIASKGAGAALGAKVGKTGFQ